MTQRVGAACAALRSGGIAAVTDDPGREAERAEALQLHPRRGGQGDRQGTASLVSVDLHRGTTAIFGHLGVGGVVLTTNNPDEVQQLRDPGMVVRDRNPVHSRPTAQHLRHLTTTLDRTGHLRDSTPRLPAEAA